MQFLWTTIIRFLCFLFHVQKDKPNATSQQATEADIYDAPPAHWQAERDRIAGVDNPQISAQDAVLVSTQKTAVAGNVNPQNAANSAVKQINTHNKQQGGLVKTVRQATTAMPQHYGKPKLDRLQNAPIHWRQDVHRIQTQALNSLSLTGRNANIAKEVNEAAEPKSTTIDSAVEINTVQQNRLQYPEPKHEPITKFKLTLDTKLSTKNASPHPDNSSAYTQNKHTASHQTMPESAQSFHQRHIWTARAPQLQSQRVAAETNASTKHYAKLETHVQTKTLPATVSQLSSQIIPVLQKKNTVRLITPTVTLGNRASDTELKKKSSQLSLIKRFWKLISRRSPTHLIIASNSQQRTAESTALTTPSNRQQTPSLPLVGHASIIEQAHFAPTKQDILRHTANQAPHSTHNINLETHQTKQPSMQESHISRNVIPKIQIQAAAEMPRVSNNKPLKTVTNWPKLPETPAHILPAKSKHHAPTINRHADAQEKHLPINMPLIVEETNTQAEYTASSWPDLLPETNHHPESDNTVVLSGMQSTAMPAWGATWNV